MHIYTSKHIQPRPLRHALHIMPYYGLFSPDLHIIDLWWRSLMCTLLLYSMTRYDITMGHGIAWDARLWTREISLHKNNLHDLHRVITHSLVLVILLCISSTRKIVVIIQSYCGMYAVIWRLHQLTWPFTLPHKVFKQTKFARCLDMDARY